MHTVLPALLAVAAAFFVAFGSGIRQQATMLSPRITVRWLVGAAVAFFGFALQMLALALGSVLLVQPLMVLSVLFALPIDRWLTDRVPSRVQWLWGVLLTIGVVLFVAFADPVPARTGRHRWVIILVTTLLLLILAAMVVWAERSRRAPRALLYGTVAGSLFGIAAVLMSDVGKRLSHPVELLQHPPVYLFLVLIGAAIAAQQRAFGSGNLQQSFPAMVVAEPVVSMAMGLALLGEKLDRHDWRTGVAIGGLVLLVVGVLQLSRLSAARSDQAAVHAR